jgi:uncharacterized SAM-binding protein YcdF (DUF218 family)
MNWGRRIRLSLLFSIMVLLVSAYVCRIQVLTGLGNFLAQEDSASRADVIVVIRGDEVFFNRALTAAQLFEIRLAPYVYVSAALEDNAILPLRARGIQLPSARDNILAVLRGSGVPCERILLDQSPPGGGSAGEIARIKTMLDARAFSSAILITSWYHSRRVRVQALHALKDAGKSVAVIRATEPTNPSNWWMHRYVAIAVLEAYVKLVLDWLPFPLRFADDPSQPETAAVVPQCYATPRG